VENMVTPSNVSKWQMGFNQGLRFRQLVLSLVNIYQLVCILIVLRALNPLPAKVEVMVSCL
jgi:hypothetical protein